MMKSHHTPGPWNIGFGGMEGDDYAIITSKFQEWAIAHLEPRGYRPGNARLIAAAPDLLAALESMVATWEGPRELAALRFAKNVVDARAAIAKARGA
jgi:hypothetical protein